jgi:hypothetical protein
MEHKKFFVKDFIQYGSPCFGCGKPPSLRLLYRNKNVEKDAPWGSLNVLVDDSRVEIDLSIKYRSSLKLWIFHKTNKFLATDNSALNNYIDTHDMYLAIQCSGCMTCHHTNNLEFQLSNNVVKATTLQYELLSMPSKYCRYILSSHFAVEKTVGQILKYDDKGALISEWSIDLPLLPGYKIKNKQNLIKKLDLYILFS